MCGIFAAIDTRSITGTLLSGLKALSYRGYDSAGIAISSETGLQRKRAEGKLDNLAKVLKTTPLDGNVGIGHTRWATHGAPTKTNAHPHMTKRVAVAHNGIIENYQQLRTELEQSGYEFETDTDSEVIPVLLTRSLEQGLDAESAMNSLKNLIDGSYAIVAIFSDLPETLFATRHGSPLVVGKNRTGFFVSSDVNALLGQADSFCHLEEGDVACFHQGKMLVKDEQETLALRRFEPFKSQHGDTGKNGFRHYMLKEIFEQPSVLKRTLSMYIDYTKGAETASIKRLPIELNTLSKLIIVACGTSSYAGLVAKYWLEQFGLNTDIDIASEARYRQAPIDLNALALFISQSGETADTLAALRHFKEQGQKCMSLVNVSHSTMTQESDALLRTYADTEIGVASTKAFTSQLSVLLVLALYIGLNNNSITRQKQQQLLNELFFIPDLFQHFLDRNNDNIKNIARKMSHINNAIYLGRGIAYPLALEGALKLKEVSYIHAEAYPAGELKHGPIALVDDEMWIVMIAPPGPLFGKALSNLREVASRGAKIILLSDKDGLAAADEFIEGGIALPNIDDVFVPLLYILPLQLLAYYIAVNKGTDVDQPRNLAKSVTVE